MRPMTRFPFCTLFATLKKVHSQSGGGEAESGSDGRSPMMKSHPMARVASALVRAVAVASIASVAAGCSSHDEKTGSAVPAEKIVAPAPIPAPAPAVAPPAPPAAPMVFEGPGEKLVRELDGWKISAAPRAFGPDNLFDLIDGGAEVYVQFGLVKMVTAEYRDAGRPGISVTAEVYDMGTPRGAFGRAARFLEGKVDPSGAGKGLPEAFANRGQIGGGDLVVWQDEYLVHLTLLDERSEATSEGIEAAGAELLPKLAGAILEKIGGDTALPEVLAKFPAQKRVPRSETWQPGRLLDIEGLGAGYTVRYADGPRAWIAFATEELASPEAADAAWKAVKSSLTDGRCLAINAAGKRVVGIVQDGDAALGDALVEREAGALRAAFTRK
jgi:hypothetical protein